MQSNNTTPELDKPSQASTGPGRLRAGKRPEWERAEESKEDRNASIDLLRFISILLVVLIHINVFEHSMQTYSSAIPGVLHNFVKSCRIPVPLFFIIAGYFFGRKLSMGMPPAQMLKRAFRRLLPIFIGWNVLYFLIPGDWIRLSLQYDVVRPVYWHLLDMIEAVRDDPFMPIYRGIRVHLWFLPALLSGFTIMAGFIVFKKEKYLIPFSFALYIFSLLGNSYKGLPFSLDAPYLTKYGPFTSTLFVSLGWWMAWRRRFTRRQGMHLVIFGTICMAVETHLLCRYYGTSAHGDYLLGVVPFSLGALVLALSCPGIGQNTFFQRWGAAFTLGIFVTHVMIMDNLAFLHRYIKPVLWDLFFPVTVYLLAVGITMLLKKSSKTSWLVA